MKIALASDHRGDAAATGLAEYLSEQGHEVVMLGERGADSRDYPDSARLVGQAVSQGDADRGILICGSGIGMNIAANKVPRVRAAVAHDGRDAEMSRRHNDTNVLCLSADRQEQSHLNGLVQIWLDAEFEGGRHATRVEKIHALETSSA